MRQRLYYLSDLSGWLYHWQEVAEMHHMPKVRLFSPELLQHHSASLTGEMDVVRAYLRLICKQFLSRLLLLSCCLVVEDTCCPAPVLLYPSSTSAPRTPVPP